MNPPLGNARSDVGLVFVLDKGGGVGEPARIT